MKRLMCLVLMVVFADAAAGQEVREVLEAPKVHEAQEDHGPYLGVSLGSFNYKEDSGQFGIFVDDAASAYRIVGGYRLNDHFALEGSWGEARNIGNSTIFSNGTAGVQGDYELLTVRALGILPLGDRISLYGALGYYEAEFDATVTNSFFASSFDAENRTDGATLAFGALFELERVDVRAEVERFLDSGSEAWGLNVGVFFRF